MVPTDHAYIPYGCRPHPCSCSCIHAHASMLTHPCSIAHASMLTLMLRMLASMLLRLAAPCSPSRRTTATRPRPCKRRTRRPTCMRTWGPPAPPPLWRASPLTLMRRVSSVCVRAHVVWVLQRTDGSAAHLAAGASVHQEMHDAHTQGLMNVCSVCECVYVCI